MYNSKPLVQLRVLSYAKISVVGCSLVREWQLNGDIAEELSMLTCLLICTLFVYVNWARPFLDVNFVRLTTRIVETQTDVSI